MLRSQAARRLPLAKPLVQLETLHAEIPQASFSNALARAELWPLTPTRLEILQVNVGKLCNQTCQHCHVDAGPDRREQMSREVFEDCLRAIELAAIPAVDITGGAPELNPAFRWFVERAHKLGCHVIDRCNLTVLETPSNRDLPDFLAANNVEVICSLPHYLALSTDAQRGEGVFAKSVSGLRRLNAVGYGTGKQRLVLVANPVGAFLPAAQGCLEKEWKVELSERHDLHFDALYTITNMPISRYLEWLIQTGNLTSYLSKLVQSFNPSAARSVMCRNTLSVGYDGQLYDCDFNQMLELPVSSSIGHIRDFDLETLNARQIRVDSHCFGCTAGAGSSCGGAVT